MIDIKKLAEIQPSLTGNEFSVLFYITNSCNYAQSIGLEYYEASFKQIREHANIKNDHTIKSVLDRLSELGLITKQTEWSDEQNRKTKCKFTSTLVIPNTTKNGVEPLQKIQWSHSKKWSGATPKNGEIIKEKKTKDLNKIKEWDLIENI